MIALNIRDSDLIKYLTSLHHLLKMVSSKDNSLKLFLREILEAMIHKIRL